MLPGLDGAARCEVVLRVDFVDRGVLVDPTVLPADQLVELAVVQGDAGLFTDEPLDLGAALGQAGRLLLEIDDESPDIVFAGRNHVRGRDQVAVFGREEPRATAHQADVVIDPVRARNKVHVGVIKDQVDGGLVDRRRGQREPPGANHRDQLLVQAILAGLGHRRLGKRSRHRVIGLDQYHRRSRCRKDPLAIERAWHRILGDLDRGEQRGVGQHDQGQ